MPFSLKFFGTDGVRGVANEEPMTPHSLQCLASAAGSVFNRGNHRHQVVIGKDTRLSGYMIESTLTAGFVAVGMDVMLLGPIPTPAVAMLTRTLRADLGVMISASHNPYEDNGIKFFGPDGHKLSRNIEAAIEKKMEETNLGFVSTREMGKARRLEDASGRYVEFVKGTFPRSIRLDGLRVVVDCAHGAAYKVALPVFWELGAEVIPIGDQPDGCNINENCGALHIEALRQTVLEEEADIGIALDGDADRLVVVDEKGTALDGDQVIALIATSWQKSGRLTSSTIVGTVMSNLGLELYLKSLDLSLERTPVGDRHVSEKMRALESNVGGEQSGHIILKDYATTGDGLIAALQVLEVLVRSGKAMSEVGHVFDTVPQVLKSQRFIKDPLDNEIVLKKIKSVEDKLKGRGRLLVRKSGTEPLIRVMAEGSDEEEVVQEVQGILDVMDQQGRLAAG